MSFERLEPGTHEWQMFFANHVQRYDFAAELLRVTEPPARRLLDFACGVGYGARRLADSTGAEVVAADRDPGALATARRLFDHPAIEWCEDDCERPTVCPAHAPFDAVVSFETLEHLQAPMDFLRPCRELLAPDGTLIISSPNARVSSPDGTVQWAYHEHEYTAPQLIAMLADAGFSTLDLYGQRLTALGRLRRDVRAEVNRLRSNPAVRLGHLAQRWLRRLPVLPPALPESLDDLEITRLASADACEAEGVEGPFVLLCVAR